MGLNVVEQEHQLSKFGGAYDVFFFKGGNGVLIFLHEFVAH